MKKLSVLAILVLAITILLIPSMCFADAAGSYSLSSIYVTMTDPAFNTVVPTDIDAGKNMTVSNIVWKDPNGKALANNDKMTSGGNYVLSFDLNRIAGDNIAGRTSVYINQSSEGVTRTFVSSNKMTVTKSFQIQGGRLSNASGKAQYMDEANYKTVSTIKATINGPKQGEPLDQSPKMEETEGAIVVGVVWERLDTTTDKWVEITDKEYKAEVGVQYRASILFKFDVGFKIDPNVKEGWVNTWNVCPVSGHNTSAHVITSLTFSIRPTNGSTGSRPSTSTTTDTTTETTSTPARPTRPTTGTLPSRPSTSNTTPTRPSTTLSSGEKEIKTSGDALPVEEAKSSGETKPAEEVKPSGETKPEEKPAETKPEEKPAETKPEEKVETIVWTEASNWAIEELNKANEAGLIPTIFNKQSLKKNITRKEFAHVAVRLYEKLTGKKAEAVEKNPFKDTKDEEVLKAYKLEITNGISDTEFAPDNEITREQMATMMARALKAAGIDVSVDLANVKEFSDDKEMHNWSRSAIYFMSNIEIIKGVGDNKFDVNGTATREQALLVSYRSANKFAK